MGIGDPAGARDPLRGLGRWRNTQWELATRAAAQHLAGASLEKYPVGIGDSKLYNFIEPVDKLEKYPVGIGDIFYSKRNRTLKIQLEKYPVGIGDCRCHRWDI